MLVHNCTCVWYARLGMWNAGEMERKQQGGKEVRSSLFDGKDTGRCLHFRLFTCRLFRDTERHKGRKLLDDEGKFMKVFVYSALMRNGKEGRCLYSEREGKARCL